MTSTPTAPDDEIRARLERADVRFGSGPPQLSISSCDPDDGCPDVLVLTDADGKQRVVVERQSMRPLEGQDHDWSFDTLDQATTLCDRAEHALGAPVELRMTRTEQGLRAVSAKLLTPPPTFLDAPYRLVSLLSRDEGPIAPLAVDALSLALEDDAPQGVLRLFARAYRRIGDGGTADRPRPSLIAATRRAAEVALEATEPLGEARALRAAIFQRCTELDTVDVARLPSSSLGRALRARRELVADAERWLDRARASTGAALDVLDSTLGPIPERVVADLVAVQPSEDRVRREDELSRFAREAAAASLDLHRIATWPPAMRERAESLRSRTTDLRPLGLDVRPEPYGTSLTTLGDAMARSLTAEDDRARRSRAHEQVQKLGPKGVFSPARQGLVRGLLSLFSRLAAAKGEVADALALALVRLRAVACEAGARLVDEGILEEASDALYLSTDELEDALRGEAVAFASRARSRREEDARFRSFAPPRRLAARGP